jgi:hypothetical protein
MMSNPPSDSGPPSTANTCRWSEKESEKLFEAATQHGNNWTAVARLIPGRNKTECQARWTAELDAARAATKICMRPLQSPPRLLKKDEAIVVGKRARFDSRKLQKDEDVDSPAAKRPRVDSPISTPVDVAAPSDWIVVASTYSATAASLEQPSIWKVAEEEDAEPTESAAGEESDLDEMADLEQPSSWKAAEEDAEPAESITGEEADLVEVAEILGKGFMSVAEVVPGEANTQCPQVLANTLMPGGDPTIVDNKLGRWTAEEDSKLIAAVAALEKLGKKEWTEVAKLVPGRTNNQCRIRWVMQLDPSGGPTINMGSWTENEYVELVGAVKRHGSKLVSGRKNWSNELRLAVAATTPETSSLQQQPINLPQVEDTLPRQLQQAKDTQSTKRPPLDTPLSTTTTSRNNVASIASTTVASHAQSPSVTGQITYTGRWTKKEKDKLFDAVELHGNTNWVAVALLIPGRDKSQCQARWTSELDAARAAAKFYASSLPPPRQQPPQEPQSQQCKAPPQMMHQEEGIPAAKRLRFETSLPNSQVEVVDLSTTDTMQQDEDTKRPHVETSRPIAPVEAVHLSTTDTGATDSCDDKVDVASTSAATEASHAQPRNWWRWWQQQ